MEMWTQLLIKNKSIIFTQGLVPSSDMGFKKTYIISTKWLTVYKGIQYIVIKLSKKERQKYVCYPRILLTVFSRVKSASRHLQPNPDSTQVQHEK